MNMLSDLENALAEADLLYPEARHDLLKSSIEVGVIVPT